MSAFDQNDQYAYANIATQRTNPRLTEYSIIASVTAKLYEAASDKENDYSRYVAALSDNRKLWTFFASMISDSSNLLPRDLKASIFWLAEYIQMRSRELLETGGDPTDLIDINKFILEALVPKIETSAKFELTS